MLKFEIVVDKGETPNKCTILPLSYRQDFEILRPARSEAIPQLQGELLLHPDGKPLSDFHGRSIDRLSVIDSNWKWLPLLVARVEPPLPELASIPPGFVTAYPRRSKKNTDPEAGLATIEAVFIAAAFLGHWDESLFAEYYFAKDFLQANRDTFKQYGILPGGKL